MREMTRILKMSLLGVIFVTLISSLSFAVDPIEPKTGIIDTEKLGKPIPIPLPDLVVTDIYGGTCPNCGCGRTNFQNHLLVEYQEDIIVKVRNQGNAASGPCTLRIQLYDVIGGRMATINKSVPRLERGSGQTIIEHGEYLYRKSTGIVATIDSTNTVNESNEANNTKTVNECAVEGPI
jgi:hypothetical protein